MVPLEKIPEFKDSWYGDIYYYCMMWREEIIYNNRFRFRHCETAASNQRCYYLQMGCTRCVIKGSGKDIMVEALKRIIKMKGKKHEDK